MIQLKSLKTGNIIQPDYVKLDGLHNMVIYTPDHKEMLGRALILEPENKEYPPVLLDIYIYDEENRRKGAADDLMEVICETFPVVITGKSTTRGRSLCLKHGFKEQMSDKGAFLVYTMPPEKMYPPTRKKGD